MSLVVCQWGVAFFPAAARRVGPALARPGLSQNRTCGPHIRLFKRPSQSNRLPCLYKTCSTGCKLSHEAANDTRRSANQALENTW